MIKGNFCGIVTVYASQGLVLAWQKYTHIEFERNENSYDTAIKIFKKIAESQLVVEKWII